MNDDKNESSDNTIILDLGDYGAAQPSYTLGSDTITIDTSSLNYSTTYPSSYTFSSGASTTYSWNNSTYDPAVNITSDGITMKEGSDIKVGGKSLTEAIEKIEERLGILKPNPELEDRWEQLKSLRQQYIDLEKELVEKEKMWEILKKS